MTPTSTLRPRHWVHRLATPRQPRASGFSRLLTLADGRALCYQVYGAMQGTPLYVLHGFPGSRLQAALVRLQAEAAGVRLVAFDRPGFGWSTPAPARRIVDIASDVAALADHLGDSEFGVLGISCGGAYALACAHEIPGRIRYTGLVAGMGPMDDPVLRHGQMPYLQAMFALARRHRWLAAPLLLPDRLMFRANPARAVRALMRMLTAPDRALLNNDNETLEIFAASLAEAYRQGLGGVLTEAALIGGPRDFDVAGIRIPVHVYQGGCDRHVPPVMGRYLARRMPQGILREYPDEGHLSLLVNRCDDMLGDFLSAAGR